MQEPTHILAGVIIQKCFTRMKYRKVALALTAVTAFLSHGFLDKLAQMTFHPAKPDFHSFVWVAYHTMVAIVTVLFLVIWWRRWKWGIFFAMLPDVDWIFIHGQEILHVRIPFYTQPHLHHLLGFIYEKIPPFSWVTPYLDRLPNYRHNPLAALWEVLLVFVMLAMLRLLKPARSTESMPAKLEAV